MDTAPTVEPPIPSGESLLVRCQRSMRFLKRFPDKRFLINIKSRDPEEGRQLAKRLKQLPTEHQARLMSYGGDEPENTLSSEMPNMKTMGKKRLMQCMTRYVAYGWIGIVPQACHNTLIFDS